MKRPNKYGARKQSCRANHTHDSGREAKRCDELHLMLRAGDIEELEMQPKFTFVINGKPLKHKNGHTAGFKPDFRYVDRHSGADIVEDSKGFTVRDYPLRAALFRALFPGIVLREV